MVYATGRRVFASMDMAVNEEEEKNTNEGTCTITVYLCTQLRHFLTRHLKSIARNIIWKWVRTLWRDRPVFLQTYYRVICCKFLLKFHWCNVVSGRLPHCVVVRWLRNKNKQTSENPSCKPPLFLYVMYFTTTWGSKYKIFPWIHSLFCRLDYVLQPSPIQNVKLLFVIFAIA